jgi:hypothetical protein
VILRLCRIGGLCLPSPRVRTVRYLQAFCPSATDGDGGDVCASTSRSGRSYHWSFYRWGGLALSTNNLAKSLEGPKKAAKPSSPTDSQFAQITSREDTLICIILLVSYISTVATPPPRSGQFAAYLGLPSHDDHAACEARSGSEVRQSSVLWHQPIE